MFNVAENPINALFWNKRKNNNILSYSLFRHCEKSDNAANQKCLFNPQNIFRLLVVFARKEFETIKALFMKRRKAFYQH